MNSHIHTHISVLAPARLHMGFMDLSGALGRNFGSIGVALNEINTQLDLKAAPSLHITGTAATQRCEKILRGFCDVLKVSSDLHLHINNTIPEHVGLGSGTQLSLAIGAAINAFYNLNLSIPQIAQLSDRGARSGIGIGVFEFGGLVVDGGRGKNTLTPPVISKMPIPDDWRFILVFDKRGQGLHGQQEVQAFQELPPFPEQEAARLCYLLLMQGLPAIAEDDLEAFGSVISQLQQSVGEHFASAQGGVFTSPEVATAMTWLQNQGAVAVGQTSWGPTGFCAVRSEERATALIAELQTTASSHLSFQVVRACNQAAQINHL